MFRLLLPVRRRRGALAGALLLALPTLAPAQAQTPPWQVAASGNPNQPGTGGTSQALATAINGAGDVFVTGTFTGSVAFGTTRLTSLGTGTTDVFVAKWSASAGAFTWAARGGGVDNDAGRGIAVRGTSVYVTGSFTSGSGVVIAGQALTGAGGLDAFVARYSDTSTGSTPATSSFANGWAVSAGGTGLDVGLGVAAGSLGVYVTGTFASGTAAIFAGQALAGAGGLDAFVAKYSDTSTGTTPATSSYANGWAASAGGTGSDQGYGVAVRGSAVFVAGTLASGSAASVAGQALAGAGGTDAFVAKYNDTSSGSTPATSSYANAWAVSGGGTGNDAGLAVAVSGPAVYVAGQFASGTGAAFAGQALAGAGGLDAFVARYNDTSTGTTPATSSVDTGWAASGGGPGTDTGNAVAVSGTGVYVAGNVLASATTTVAGQPLPGTSVDVFAARYTDTSTGTTAATSSYTNTWAASGGGPDADGGLGVAVGSAAVYVAGQVGPALAGFGVAPARLYAPASSAVLGVLNLGTGTWLQADGPLQGGTSTTRALATDASGNVFVAGDFTGTVGFGSTRLVSAGGADVFVAKWDATAQGFTWATSGGGTADDSGYGIAVRGSGVYVTGYFQSATGVNLAGKALTGAGDVDAFVAKYLDTSTGSTPAASSYQNGWAVSAGGTGPDQGQGVAVSGTGVYVTGFFFSGSAASIAGKALTGAGGADAFVAKYIDTSTGTTTATSSVANGWAMSAGSVNSDIGYGVAASGTGVFVTGTVSGPASVAGTTLTGTVTGDMFVAKYIDTSTGNTTATSSVANGWATSGGGPGSDAGYGVAVSGKSVYVAGTFGSFGSNPASVAGTTLTSAGGLDAFVAKYSDTSTGNTTATSSYANGWAASAGGTGNDLATGVAVSGTAVFVGGTYASASFSAAGQTLGNGGGNDLFAVKYLDTSTGTTPATSSYANGWSIGGGGAGFDAGYGLAVSGQQLYAVGTTTPPASFGIAALSNAASGQINLLTRLTDATLAPLAAQAAAPGAAGLALYPNPTSGAVTLTGTAPGTAVQVLDALGRLVLTATADAAGTARLAGGLVPGVYVVRAGAGAVRLVVE